MNHMVPKQSKRSHLKKHESTQNYPNSDFMKVMSVIVKNEILFY